MKLAGLYARIIPSMVRGTEVARFNRTMASTRIFESLSNLAKDEGPVYDNHYGFGTQYYRNRL